jgi:hypothetical protein
VRGGDAQRREIGDPLIGPSRVEGYPASAAAAAAEGAAEMRLRKNQSDSSEATEEDRTRRRREGRGWGPFSGGQLAAIIIAVVVMVMLPVGAWAVSGTSVFVTDAVNGTHATVIPTGQLNVGEAAPKNFIIGAVDPGLVVGSGTFTPVLTADSTHALVITSALIDVYTDATPGAGDAIALAVSRTNATCSSVVQNGFTFAAVVNPGSIGATDLPFQPGIVIPASRSLCAANFDEANLSAEVHAFGYKISAAAAPVGAAFVPRSSLPPSLRKH